MQAALEERSLASFFERSKDFHVGRRQPRFAETQPNDPIAETLAAQLCQAAQLAKQNPQPVLDFLRSVSQLVDKPGYAQVGADLADFSVGILNQASQAMPEAEILALQVHLSAANHLGERHLADPIWEQYIQREEQLKELGLRGLELMAEMRNRRAISRLDQFCFDEAKIILAYILTHVEQGLESLARMFNVSAAQLPTRLIGTLYGTLGQIYALQSEPDHRRAEECFRKALGFFTVPEDRQRQWVYLGHLACDQGEQGRALWQEVCAELPDLTSLSPIAEEGKQYVLALQIKGQYVFGTLADILAFLTNWQNVDLTSAYSAPSRQLHPFGLIHQGLGILYERAWRETQNIDYANRALDCYHQAAELMDQGGPVLKVLSRIARSRRWLVKSELPGAEERALQRLRELFLGLRGYLAEYFGESAWAEGPDGRSYGHFGRLDPGPAYSWQERTRAILRAIRFNYW